MIQIDHDPEADALYIRLRSADVADTRQAANYIYIDVDGEGAPLGIELLFASQLIAQNGLMSVAVNFSSPMTLAASELAPA
jgi:uncharacterized protein YuzE